ncbi:hypothetical protein SY88_19190 [Clostridiales bacterium PH28_bin88]|nr:hypothetical protein SY88_19190 [Clostridiales bacterium PH28_bin88]
MKGYLVLTVASFLYGGNVVAARVISSQVPPVALAAFRGLLGLVVLMLLARRQLVKSPRLCFRDLLLLALMGFFGFTVAYTSFLWGMQRSSATNAAIIIATIPAVTNALLAIGWHLKPSRYQVLGIGASFFGLLVVFSGGSLARLLALNLSLGDVALLVNVLAVALFTIMVQEAVARFSSQVSSVYALMFGTAMLVPLGVWEVITQGWHLAWQGWLILLYMGGVVSGFTVFLHFEGISCIGSGRASIFNNLTPVFSIILAVWLLGERLTIYHWVGFGLVLGGIALSLGRGHFGLYTAHTKTNNEQ